jgi:hypothetical protein
VNNEEDILDEYEYVTDIEWEADNHWTIYTETDAYGVWAMGHGRGGVVIEQGWWIVYSWGERGPESSDGPFETVEAAADFIEAMVRATAA